MRFFAILVAALLLFVSVAHADIRPPGYIVAFQVKMTGSAVQFPANLLVNGISCYAKGANAASIEIGGSGVTTTVDGTGNGSIVAAGAGWSIAVSNSNIVYAIGTNNDVLSCWGN